MTNALKSAIDGEKHATGACSPYDEVPNGFLRYKRYPDNCGLPGNIRGCYKQSGFLPKRS
jgi:hypothetical protein